jgi:hypothetical protein
VLPIVTLNAVKNQLGSLSVRGYAFLLLAGIRVRRLILHCVQNDKLYWIGSSATISLAWHSE